MAWLTAHGVTYTPNDTQNENNANNNLLRRKLADAWNACYGAMNTAFKAQLTPAWRSVIRMMCYEDWFSTTYGFPGWGTPTSWLLQGDRGLVASSNDPVPFGRQWDGGSASWYAYPNENNIWGSTDVRNTGLVPFVDAARTARPDYWFEYSLNDFTDYSSGANLAQPDNVAYWTGHNRMMLWATQARASRYFTMGWTDYAHAKPFMDASMIGIDEIWNKPILTKFWRGSTLINLGIPHPFGASTDINGTAFTKSDPITGYTAVQRWFFLRNSVDSYLDSSSGNPNYYDTGTGRWKLVSTNIAADHIKCFAIARVRGLAGAREFLIYAFAGSPNNPTLTNVTVTIPGYTTKVLPTVTRQGNFYQVLEADGVVVAV
jgi:hypothetical protein